MCPYPLKSPVSLSVEKRTCVIVPQSLKASRRVSSSTSQDKFPTKTVIQPSCFSLAARGAIIDLGVEYLIDNQRPSKSAPFNSIAASAEAVSLNSTTAVPELRPSSCKGNSIVVGPLPHDLKKSRTCSSSALHGKPLMYNLGGGPSLSVESFCFFMGGSEVCSSSSFASFRFFDAFSSSSESESESLSDDESSSSFLSTSIFSTLLSSSSSSSESELSEPDESSELSSFLAVTLVAGTTSFFSFSSSDEESSSDDESLLDSSFFTSFLTSFILVSFLLSSSESESELDESEPDESFFAIVAMVGFFLVSSSLSESESLLLLLLLLLLSESLPESSFLRSSSASFSAALMASSAAFFASSAAFCWASSSAAFLLAFLAAFSSLAFAFLAAFLSGFESFTFFSFLLDLAMMNYPFIPTKYWLLLNNNLGKCVNDFCCFGRYHTC
mmetsp:Transcript_25225/g.28809  ORF Transcript_25225/g.28809 Transcript_25225/m.28809 type:complete len:442 (-) Transcript_25225:4-1329(-)